MSKKICRCTLANWFEENKVFIWASFIPLKIYPYLRMCLTFVMFIHQFWKKEDKESNIFISLILDYTNLTLHMHVKCKLLKSKKLTKLKVLIEFVHKVMMSSIIPTAITNNKLMMGILFPVFWSLCCVGEFQLIRYHANPLTCMQLIFKLSLATLIKWCAINHDCMFPFLIL